MLLLFAIPDKTLPHSEVETGDRKKLLIQLKAYKWVRKIRKVISIYSAAWIKGANYPKASINRIQCQSLLQVNTTLFIHEERQRSLRDTLLQQSPHPHKPPQLLSNIFSSFDDDRQWWQQGPGRTYLEILKSFLGRENSVARIVLIVGDER